MRTKLILTLLAAPMILGAQQAKTDTAFHPISLVEALRLAHDNSLQNITSDNAIRTATNNIRTARASLYYPNVNLTASQTRQYGDRLGQSNSLVSIDPRWAYNTGLQAQFVLYDGGKSFADVRTQRANVAAAQANEVNTEYSVALNVKTAYNAVLAAKESESAARAQLATAQSQLATSIAKVAAGAANVSDSLRGVLLVGNAQLALLGAQNNFLTQSAALTRFVGTPYFVTAQLADTAESLGAPIDSAMVMQLALAGPTVRAADASITAATAAERSVRAQYLPTLGASLNMGGSGTSAVYGLNGNAYPYNRSIGFNLSYPLFNRFQRETQVSNAQITYDNATATAKDARLAAQQNVVTGIAALRNAEETMRVQQTSVRASEEDLRVVTQRYNLGASTLLDVLTSQQQLATARQQLIQARLNYRNARAQIEAAIGRDLP